MADLDTLIENLKNSDYYARATAARALGELGGEKAAEALIEALGDPDDWVQDYAAEALGKLAYRPAVAPLGELLKSDNYKVRCSAAAALGMIGGEDARTLLEPLREDNDSWVREAVIDALKKLSAEPAPAPIEEPAFTPEPPAPDSEPELTLSEEPAPPELLARAARHSLAGQAPRTPEEIVKLIAEDPSIKYRATRSGFLLRVHVGSGRRQMVRLKFDSVDEDGSPIIQIFTIVGPARSKHYRWALKLNPTFSYGAIGLVKIDGKELLAIIDTLLEENIDVKALQKSIWTLARRADALERKLIRKDLW